MAVERERPYLNGNFLVDIGTGDAGSVRAGFSEVFLPESGVDVVEYRNGNEKTNEPRKLMGSVGYGNLVLRRGLIGALDLYEWFAQARNGDPGARRNVTVRLLAEDRSDAVFTWKFTNAWPTRYDFSQLSAGDSEVVIEEIELAFERMEIE